MGYSHHFKLNAELNDIVVNKVKVRMMEYSNVIVAESDKKDKAIFEKDLILFNGIGEEGAESLCIQSNTEDYCKTYRRNYDLAVCETLLIMKGYYRENFELSSDGFWVSKNDFESKTLDENWNEAIQNIKEVYGYEFDLIGKVSHSGNYTYYNFEIK